MKSVDRKNFEQVGLVSRIHGTRGEVKILLSQNTKFKEWVFLEYRGKPVPFFIESSRETFDDEYILKLKGIDSIEKADEICNRAVLMPASGKKKKVTRDQTDELKGFRVLDESLGEIGIVEGLEEYPSQLMIRVVYNEREVLIPVVDEFISEVNTRKKCITTTLPDGFLDT